MGQTECAVISSLVSCRSTQLQPSRSPYPLSWPDRVLRASRRGWPGVTTHNGFHHPPSPQSGHCGWWIATIDHDNHDRKSSRRIGAEPGNSNQFPRSGRRPGSGGHAKPRWRCQERLTKPDIMKLAAEGRPCRLTRRRGPIRTIEAQPGP